MVPLHNAQWPRLAEVLASDDVAGKFHKAEIAGMCGFQMSAHGNCDDVCMFVQYKRNLHTVMMPIMLFAANRIWPSLD